MCLKVKTWQVMLRSLIRQNRQQVSVTCIRWTYQPPACVWLGNYVSILPSGETLVSCFLSVHHLLVHMSVCLSVCLFTNPPLAGFHVSDWVLDLVEKGFDVSRAVHSKLGFASCDRNNINAGKNNDMVASWWPCYYWEQMIWLFWLPKKPGY